MRGSRRPCEKSFVKYRPEIDGLRAVAVLGVILFHAGLPFLPGGFLGVDVFFVISGYLITGIIFNDLRRGSFSFARFFERRVRRIIPALNVTMLLCVPIAVWLLLPDDLENFGQSLIATAAFSNNILLMLTSGYFDLANTLKPLMHTWSLGVEEQYYLLAPLLVGGSFALAGRKGVMCGLIVVGIASFVLALWLASHAPNSSFYLVFTRAWEFAAGALAFFLEPAIRAHGSRREGSLNALSVLGLAVVLISFFAGMGAAHPGWPTLLPVIGAALLLSCSGPGDLSGRVLCARPMLGLGLISYSAYLYHQPIFAFVRIARLSEPPLTLMLILTVPVLILARLSWRLIEQPFRDGKRIRFRTTAIFSLVTTALIVLAGVVAVSTSGFLQLRPELATNDPQFGWRQNAIYNEGPMRFAYVNLPKEPQQTGAPRLLVIGNSFARDFINMGLESGALKPGRFSYAPLSSCSVDAKALQMATRADIIVVALSSPASAFGCVDQGLIGLEHVTSAKIYLLGIKNFGWNNNAVMLLPAATRYSLRVPPIAKVAETNARAREYFADRYLDLLAKISDGEGRVPVFTPDRKFISQDTNHLTKAGARYIGSILFRDPALQRLWAD